MSSAEEVFYRRCALSRLLCENSYFGYLRAFWHSSAAFGYYNTALTLFRRARLVRLIFRIVQALWIALQTGTLVLLLLPVLLILLPGVLLLSLLMLLGGVLEYRRLRTVMTERLRGKTVLFLQVDGRVLDEGGGAGGFFRGQLRELNRQKGVIVIVRSPYLFSAKGLGGKGFYLAQRREAKQVYLVRTYGFFTLRTIARRAAAQVIFVA